ncbi:MAG: alcohol dehydrogenase catalytic domain-containing protein [Ilumatobacter sp.]|nr:alcohol dehydrogenase catalytic domain-containing protein [Ilumatobacter sp.]
MNDLLTPEPAADPQQRRGNDDAPTMRAVVQDRYGSAASWEIRDVERPAIGPDEVLVRVAAAGLDRGTWHEMTGRPYLIRAMGFGLRAPKRRTPGRAVAGVVAAVGADVTHVAVGDRVFGAAVGSFAEYAVASADKLALAPSAITAELAAAVPISATTALQGLRPGGIAAGRRVLILGASGGVGTSAVQSGAVRGKVVIEVATTARDSVS